MHGAPRQRAALLLEVPVGDAVLHGHDHGVGAEELGQLRHHRLDLVRLHCQDHDVLRAGLLVAVGGLYLVRHLLAALGADELEAVGGDGVQVLAPHDESDVLPGQRELGAHQAADRAGADHCNLHDIPR
ncbi:hypothetical protein D3C84_977220 [compost metagenome]